MANRRKSSALASAPVEEKAAKFLWSDEADTKLALALRSYLDDSGKSCMSDGKAVKWKRSKKPNGPSSVEAHFAVHYNKNVNGETLKNRVNNVCLGLLMDDGSVVSFQR
jgi:hypothetical protein